LPRGRTYVRNGSVVDLKIQPGKITALVSGSSLYQVAITISPLPGTQWSSIKSRCSGEIGSLVELLKGQLSKGVMDVVTAQEGGLFPKPREIKLSCSCPDWADMCKHVAAVMYGVGARLDQQPELLFLLRNVDHLELIEEAVPRASKKTSTGKKTLEDRELADVFGIEFAGAEATEFASSAAKQTEKPRRRAARAAENLAPTPRKAGKPTQSAKASLPAPKATSTARRSGRAKKNEAVQK
jgi:uncharacterized Zn finger protein